MRSRSNAVASSRGAIIVEAAITLPFVFLVIGAIIFIGLYQYQGALIQAQAQKVANLSAKMVMQPGYDRLGERSYSKVDFSAIADPIPDQALDAKPYRYWAFKFEQEQQMEQELDKLVKRSTFIKLSNPRIDMKYENKLATQRFTVTVDSSIRAPAFFAMLKLPTVFEQKVEAVAIISDPAEFVRNTDIAFDLTQKLAARIGDNANVQVMLQRVKDLRNRFF